jgi:hypothetical protein
MHAVHFRANFPNLLFLLQYSSNPKKIFEVGMKIASYSGNGENKGGDAANIGFYFGWQQLWE